MSIMFFEDCLSFSHDIWTIYIMFFLWLNDVHCIFRWSTCCIQSCMRIHQSVVRHESFVQTRKYWLETKKQNKTKQKSEKTKRNLLLFENSIWCELSSLEMINLGIPILFVELMLVEFSFNVINISFESSKAIVCFYWKTSD